MKSSYLLGVCVVVGSGLCGSALAQNAATINSDRLFPREFNDDPTSNLNVINNYPAQVQFSDQSVDHGGTPGGFANRHVWRFSNDGGASTFHFSNNSFFDVFFDLTLSGTVSPRKEAGYLFDTAGGQGQFIVNTDAHEIVAFGGPLPFFAFPATFNSGDTIRLGMTYFLDSNDGMRKIIYHAGALSSPALAFTNLEQGIIDGTTLGGYLQVVIDANNPQNGAIGNWGNIHIVPAPGGAALALVGLGMLARRRR